MHSAQRVDLLQGVGEGNSGGLNEIVSLQKRFFAISRPGWDNTGTGAKYSNDWRTPSKLFRPLHAEFSFTLDGAASLGNNLLPRWYGSDKDGLQQSWTNERVFCNPPYADVSAWVSKAFLRKQDLAILLLPCRLDTIYWHKYILGCADQICFIKGRIQFERPGGSSGHSNFASALVLYGAGDLSSFGFVVSTYYGSEAQAGREALAQEAPGADPPPQHAGGDG
jgi:phage N-6-adenine-methyltransferase